eukprot:TRINITY_DN48480_c0_g1_i1.p1 TRINITY_DN48480_c0_g1~~TRINITY_DN48480_c0_g1_i1.p1  ORF type:complete len:319 (+),score=17.43 TRINITY_DN48480_c0_g1_i1:6-962(+)
MSHNDARKKCGKINQSASKRSTKQTTKTIKSNPVQRSRTPKYLTIPKKWPENTKKSCKSVVRAGFWFAEQLLTRDEVTNLLAQCKDDTQTGKPSEKQRANCLKWVKKNFHSKVTFGKMKPYTCTVLGVIDKKGKSKAVPHLPLKQGEKKVADQLELNEDLLDVALLTKTQKTNLTFFIGVKVLHEIFNKKSKECNSPKYNVGKTEKGSWAELKLFGGHMILPRAPSVGTKWSADQVEYLTDQQLKHVKNPTGKPISQTDIGKLIADPVNASIKFCKSTSKATSTRKRGVKPTPVTTRRRRTLVPSVAYIVDKYTVRIP